MRLSRAHLDETRLVYAHLRLFLISGAVLNMTGTARDIPLYTFYK